MTNHLLSFLGTGNYEPCCYQFRGKKSAPVPYVQVALLELLEEFQSPLTRVSFFLTQQAREKHWDPPKHEPAQGYGLSSILSKKFPTVTVQPVTIPEGKSTDELWEIFRIIYDRICEGETIHVDITHSYRSLPMFGIALLNYARTLKKITIGGIYYGAMEVLGSIKTVQTLPLDDRNAPIFDLTSVYTLMEWSTAVNLFIQTGRAEDLAAVVRAELNSVLSDPMQRNPEAMGEQKLTDKLKSISLDILTNRGMEIQKGSTFYQLNKIFFDLQGKNLNLKPLQPLLSRVGSKIAGFAFNDIRNGYRAVEWCLEHGWIQQGITQLQETIITHMLKVISIDPSDREKRELVSTVFFTKEYPIETKATQGCMKKDPHSTKTILDHSFCEVAARPYNRLRDPRNDINHGGFVGPASSQTFMTNLKEALEELKTRYRERYKEELF